MKTILNLTLFVILSFSFSRLSAQEVIKEETVKVAEQNQNSRTEQPKTTNTEVSKDKNSAAADSKTQDQQEPKKATEAAKKDAKTDNKESAPNGNQKMAINEQGVPSKGKTKAKQASVKTDTTASPKKK